MKTRKTKKVKKPERRRSYTVALHLTVIDKKVLKKAAEKRALEDGVELADWRADRKDGDPIANDLRMLLDPGVSPPGVSVTDSFAEEDL